jgi:AcrR family transcriptional regulator
MERAAVEYRYASRKGARQAQTIIEAAYRCLARDGYARTSMQRIAEEAGVQKRMLHYYFETRQKLFEQIAAYVGDRMLSPVEDAIEGGSWQPSRSSTVSISAWSPSPQATRRCTPRSSRLETATGS